MKRSVNYVLASNYSRGSLFAKSCRRLLFNHCNTSFEQSGIFHVDHMFGSGSCTLLKIGDSYFCLTARHVLHANKIDLDNLQNESPVWVLARTGRSPETLADFLFPKCAWH